MQVALETLTSSQGLFQYFVLYSNLIKSPRLQLRTKLKRLVLLCVYIFSPARNAYISGISVIECECADCSWE